MQEFSSNINELKAGLRKIKRELNAGRLTYEQAKKQAQPLVDGINWHVMDICFKYNRRIKTFSFSELLKGADK